MSQKQGNHSTKKVHGHGSGPAHKVSEVTEQPKIGQTIIKKRKNTVPVQEGENNAKKSQPPNNQKASQAPEKQKQRASATNKRTGSTSNSTIGAASAPPKTIIEYKTLDMNNLKCGDLVLALRHYAPDETRLFHWFIYIHLGDSTGGRIVHATLRKFSKNKDDSSYWMFESRDYNGLSLDNAILAYARLIGNISGLNASDYPLFERAIKMEVPVPFIQEGDSSNPNFSCRTWALSFIDYVRKEKRLTLPYSIRQLEKEMKEKGSAQAEKAKAKAQSTTSTEKDRKYTFPGYRPLLEYVVATTA